MEDPGHHDPAGNAGEQGPLAGRSLGPYEILREVGRGSNGVVYEALHEEDRSRVALKVLPANIALDRKTVARFRREAQAAQGLDHPGIVKVLAIGEDDGTHYFVMEYIEGVPLDRYAGGRELGIRAAIRIVRDVARALHDAHQHGIVHRDVKPSNLLVRADGAVLVSDFGLARLDKSATLTSTDAIVGTPKYMSPEQILAEKGAVDRRTDIYALGVTLFEMVAKEHPFEGETVQAFLKNVLESDPVRPRQINRRVSRDLETVILKAMERDLTRRYQTTLELAEDLDRLLDRRPVKARPPSPLLRFLAWTRRRRLAVTTGALGLVVVVAVVLSLVIRSGSAQLRFGETFGEARDRLTRVTDVESQGEELEAIEAMLTRAIGVRDRSVEAYLLRSRVRIHLGRYDDANLDLASARERGATAIQVAPMRAKIALRDHDWETAISRATLALGADPRDADLYFIRGAARYLGAPDGSGLDDAVKDLAACLAIDPKHGPANALKLQIADLTGDTAESDRLTKIKDLFADLGSDGAGMLGALAELVGEAARESDVLGSIGRSLFTRLVLSREVSEFEDEDAVVEQAQVELAENKNDHRAHYRLGRVRLQQGRIREAIGHLQDSVTVDEELNEDERDWEPCYWLAFAHATSTDENLWNEHNARIYASAALRFAPPEARPGIRDLQAEVSYRSGWGEDALRTMSELEKEDPERAEYYQRRAAYFREGMGASEGEDR